MEVFGPGNRYWSIKTQDDTDGYIGVKVFREQSGKQDEVASVIYWDATGEIAVSMLVDEMPIEVIEAAAVEVRKMAGLSR